MIKFYLQQIDDQHEIRCNTNSTITEIAGVFDLGTMELEWNECEHAIFPNTPFFIKETESNTIWNFIISEDNVEVVNKTNPIKYLHKLTLSQSIHKINNVPVRNSSFTQPSSSKINFSKNTFFMGVGEYHYGVYYSGPQNLGLDHFFNTNNFLKTHYLIDLSNITKISSASIKTSSIINIFNNYTGISSETTSGIITGFVNKYINSYINSVTIWFVNAEDQTETDYISVVVDQENMYKEISLSSSQLEWMKNKKFFMRVRAGTFDSNLGSLLPVSDENWVWKTMDVYNAPFVAGFLNVEININVYNYSLWDVLDILNKQCIKEYNQSHLDNFYEMPDKTTGQGLELDSIIAPEFNFTQMDLYEAVAQVLSYIDAFPILKTETINEITYNNVLGYQYLNDLSEDTIENLQVSDLKTTLNETNFTNKLASYYQNGKLANPITYPTKNLFIRAATSNYGITNPNNWYYFVNKKIDYIKSLYVLLAGSNKNEIDLPENYFYHFRPGNNDEYTVTLKWYQMKLSMMPSNDAAIEINMTPVIYESDVYNHLPEGYADTYIENKNNSLYYSRGDNKIYLGITGQIISTGPKDVLEYAITRAAVIQFGFGNEAGVVFDIHYTNTKSDYCFQCSYFPILDGKVSQESVNNKIEKETIIAQNNSGSELNKVGNNLQGLIAKLGNEEKSITLPIIDLKNKIKLGTKFIDENGNNWFANRIKTTFTTDEEKVIANVVFTKNYNAMQQFTRLNQEKRFYEISERLVSKGYENINEFIYFTLQNINAQNLYSGICITSNGLKSILGKTLGGNYNTDYITTFDTVKITSHKKYGIAPHISTFIAPVVYGCGNQICFEMGYDSSLEIIPRFYDGETSSYLYTGEDGVADVFDIECKFVNKDFRDNPYKYPEIENETFSGLSMFYLNTFFYYKKPNEIFHLNYSLNFLPYWEKEYDELGTPQYSYEDIFFGDKFINENGMIPNTIYDNGKQRNLYLYVSNILYSMLDTKVIGTRIDDVNLFMDFVEESEVDPESGIATYGTIGFKNINSSSYYDVSNYVSWAIGDEQRNIYIAVNRKDNSNNEAKIIWFTSRNRKV